MNIYQFNFNAREKSYEEIMTHLHENVESFTQHINNDADFLNACFQNAIKNKNIDNLKALSTLNIKANQILKSPFEILTQIAQLPDYKERFFLIKKLNLLSTLNDDRDCTPTFLLENNLREPLEFFVSQGLSKEFGSTQYNFLSYLLDFPSKNSIKQMNDVNYILDNGYLIRISQIQTGFLYYGICNETQKKLYLSTIDAFYNAFKRDNLEALPSFMQLCIMRLYSNNMFNKKDILDFKTRYPEAKITQSSFFENTFLLDSYEWPESLRADNFDKFLILYNENISETARKNLVKHLFFYMITENVPVSDYEIFNDINVDYSEFIIEDLNLIKQAFIFARNNSYQILEPYSKIDKSESSIYFNEFIRENCTTHFSYINKDKRKFINNYIINNDFIDEVCSFSSPKEESFSLFQVAFLAKDKNFLDNIFKLPDFHSKLAEQFFHAINNIFYNEEKNSSEFMDSQAVVMNTFSLIETSLSFIETKKYIKYFSATELLECLKSAKEEDDSFFEMTLFNDFFGQIAIKNERDILNNSIGNNRIPIIAKKQERL